MERITITVDDESIDITVKSPGGDVETMEAMDVEAAVDIVRGLMIEATEDKELEDDDMEQGMEEEMPQEKEMLAMEDKEMAMEEFEKSWNEEAEKRAKERRMQDMYT